MKITPKSLKKWVQTSIEIYSLLAPEPLRHSIETGGTVLLCPSEVFDLFGKKGVIIKMNGIFFFEYLGKYGLTFVEVRKDQKGRTGLFLEEKRD